MSAIEYGKAARLGVVRGRSSQGMVELACGTDRKLRATISGLQGIALASASDPQVPDGANGPARLTLEFAFSEAMRPGYQVGLTVSKPADQGGVSVQLIRRNESGFAVGLVCEKCSDLDGFGLGVAISGFVVELTPDDRAIAAEQLVEDAHTIHNMFRNEVEFGFISLMASASVLPKERREADLVEVTTAINAIAAKPEDQRTPRERKQLPLFEAKKVRLGKLAKSEGYYVSAKTFGELWRDYVIGDMEKELGGRHIPLATGGGPGIMQAAAEGSSNLADINKRVQKAIEAGAPLPDFSMRGPLVAIDTLFVEDKRFAPSQDPASLATTRIRCNDFAMREMALINFAHVVLVWPGGVGTAWELFEVLSKVQTKHLRRDKVKVILVHGEFWRPVLAALEHFRDYGTINSHDDYIFDPAAGLTRPSGQKEFLQKYIAEVVDTPEAAFTLAREHLKYLAATNSLMMVVPN